jgi:hypothetical protein
MALTAPSLSPAIVVREFDLTATVPNVDTSLAGYVGSFKWGPVNTPKLIQSEDDLATEFGTPDTERAVDYFSCAQYLRYSGNLQVCRTIPSGTGVAVGDSALNAAFFPSPGKIVVKNLDHWEQQSISNMFVAKYPGAMGNGIAVDIFARRSGQNDTLTESQFDGWDYADKFDTYPGTSDWATKQNATVSYDEIHVAIIDSSGAISGTKGTVLEVFPFVSVAAGAKTVDGADNYVKNVINSGSRYIWWGDMDSVNTVAGSNWGDAVPASGSKDYSSGVSWSADSAHQNLTLGQDAGTLDIGDIQAGYDEFEDTEEVDVSILIAPSMPTTTDQVTLVNDLAGIAGVTRKDCVVVASPARDDLVNNIAPVTATLYDKYNDNYIYIPAASTTAGIMAAADAEYGPWWSPAGERRGQYVGVTNLAYSPKKSERDTLYKAGVNPIVQFPGRGILLFGDKTKLSRPSAFDRINVRRLFLALEKAIAAASRNFLFEFNDEFTRSEFVAIVEPVLREVQARRGIQDFLVQCDERNNTPEVIDRNEFVATILIKPSRSINFITLNFVATRTGADFEEIVNTIAF